MYPHLFINHHADDDSSSSEGDFVQAGALGPWGAHFPPPVGPAMPVLNLPNCPGFLGAGMHNMDFSDDESESDSSPEYDLDSEEDMPVPSGLSIEEAGLRGYFARPNTVVQNLKIFKLETSVAALPQVTFTEQVINEHLWAYKPLIWRFLDDYSSLTEDSLTKLASGLVYRPYNEYETLEASCLVLSYLLVMERKQKTDIAFGCRKNLFAHHVIDQCKHLWAAINKVERMNAKQKDLYANYVLFIGRLMMYARPDDKPCIPLVNLAMHCSRAMSDKVLQDGDYVWALDLFVYMLESDIHVLHEANDDAKFEDFEKEIFEELRMQCRIFFMDGRTPFILKEQLYKVLYVDCHRANLLEELEIYMQEMEMY